MIRLRAFLATTEIPENSPFTLKNAENSVKKPFSAQIPEDLSAY